MLLKIYLLQLQNIFKNGPLPASFYLFLSFQYRRQKTNLNKKFPMNGFELQTIDVRSDRSINWATQLSNLKTFLFLSFLCSIPLHFSSEKFVQLVGAASDFSCLWNALETSCLLQQQTHKAAENIILRYPCIIIIKLMPISYRKVERVGTGYSFLHAVAKFDHFHPYMSFFPREF